jgi:hypothetical protein
MRPRPGPSYVVDDDDLERENPMYPATLDHVAACQWEARRQARLHNTITAVAAANDGASRSRWSLRRVTHGRRPVPVDS